MKAYLFLVEPLRLRAVTRWLEQQQVMLICSRAFQPRPVESSSVKLARARKGVALDTSPPDLFRLLHRPDSFRGRALKSDELLGSCPLLQAVKPGDLLIVPNFPHRACLSVHRVGSEGLVAGSSATSALSLGFAIEESRGLTTPVIADLAERAALITSLPFPTGPITALTGLGSAWVPIFGAPPPSSAARALAR